MQVATNTNNYIATIGVFDGVHKGHQFLLNTLCQEASQRGLQPLVIVIDNSSADRLTTHDEQNALLKKYTSHIVHYALSDIQHLSALDFLSTVNYQLSTILMGYDHRFGADQLNYDQLVHLNNTNIQILPCPRYQRPTTNDQRVPLGQGGFGNVPSSSLIRQALRQGNIEVANTMLGYNYTLTGSVVHGNAIGRTIGFPTANIQTEPCKLIPKTGVYAATCLLNGAATKALVNIGTNPTIGNAHLTVEAYLPHYKGPDFYSQTIQLQFTKRLRDEQQFPSLSDLQHQIQFDLQQLNGN